MFKKKFMPRYPRGRFTRRCAGPVILPGFFFVFIICLAGCQTFPALAPVNLSEPGWVTRQGQAVWRANRPAPEIAGEIMMATNSDGRAFVQFTKTPLPFLTAQSTTNSWQLHSIPNDKTYSGRGRPPVRAIWLWLPVCLAGRPAPRPLAWQRDPGNTWRLENLATGESLEGYFTP
jgi:hypothetical protein